LRAPGNEITQFLDYARSHHPGFGLVHLVHYDKGVHPFRDRMHGLKELVLHERWRRTPVLEVEAIEFARRPARFYDQRFAIGERGTQRRSYKIVQPHAVALLESMIEFMAFAVLACKTDRIDFAYPQGRQVVQDRSRGAGLRSNLDDVMDRKAGFQGRLLLARINFQITIEAEIAEHGDAQPPVTSGDIRKTLRSHRPVNSWYR